MANQITTLGQKEESLSEQYDKANVDLHADQKKVAAAAKAVKAADAAESKAKGVLRSDAVNAYVHNGAAGASAVGDSTLKNANSGLLRAEYVSSMAADQSDAQDAFHLASVRAETAQQDFQAAQASAQKQVDALATARQQVQASQAKLQGVYDHETTQIANLVAQIKARQEAAAQAAATAAANARIAAQKRAEQQQEQLQEQQARQQQQVTEAAATQTTPTTAAPVIDDSPATDNAATTTTTLPPTSGDEATTTTEAPATEAPATEAPVTEAPVTDPPTTEAPTTTAPATVSAPPSSGVGAAAVAAAETQLGVPYQWGGASPGSGFDCSGLVMWAYAQVGVSLPHYSGAQFSAGVQIPMSDLEPGDLVFFADPGEHVAMYVGGGDIIEAPETGETVHIVPLYPEFVSAVRIA